MLTSYVDSKVQDIVLKNNRKQIILETVLRITSSPTEGH